MATHASAEKAARQARKRTEKNRAARSEFKTATRKLREALTAKYENKDSALKKLQPLLNDAQGLLMRAASSNLIKKNTASRQVSRLSTAIHKFVSKH